MVIPALSYVVTSTVKGKGKYLSVIERGRRLDKICRRLLKDTKARYKASCVARLYLAADLGGYGLKSIEDAVKESTIYLWAYLCTRPELLSSFNLFSRMANRGKRSVISDTETVMEAHGIKAEVKSDCRVVVDGMTFTDATLLARYLVTKMRADNNISRRKEWEGLPLAGRTARSTGIIHQATSYLWLKEGKLSSKAVRNVLAVQEGCLLTRAHPSLGVLMDSRCRACGSTIETPEHVTTNCSKWLPTLYIDRHDSVARNIYYRICLRYGLDPTHYSQRVDSVKENDRIKLYWNQPVQTKKIIKHNKPDIVVYDKERKTISIFEIAVSWFTGLEKQEEIKRNRYCVNGNWEDELNVPYPRGDNLLRELQSSGWTVSFYPIVIGACGEVLENLGGRLVEGLGIGSTKAEEIIERLQRSAVLGTSRIVQNHLAMTSN
jgi:hypothetical protein